MSGHNRNTIAGRETCGLKDPKLDLFSDMKQALNKWLMKNDQTYRFAVESATARNQRRKERTKNETTD